MFPKVIEAVIRVPNVNRPNLYFDYDGMGNRIRKRVVENPASNPVEVTSWYVRDPQGNVMAVYRTRQDTTWLVEHHLYGADRLGICEEERIINIQSDSTDQDLGDGSAKKTNNNSLPPKAEVSPKNAYFRMKGCREYEWKNHLGNVLGVVSDLKFLENPDSSLRYYAQLRSVEDYYPFGMEMVGRSWESEEYRYGFQGQESDHEVAGSGNSVFFKYRVHDPRIGRFLSVDPLASGSSRYLFTGNSPINSIDVGGLFRFDAFFVERYPNIYKLMKYYFPELQKNGPLKNAFLSTTNWTKECYNEMLSFGTGPWFTPSRYQSTNCHNSRPAPCTGHYGLFSGDDYPGNIFINYSILDRFETAIENGDKDEISFQLFWVSLISMHETGHYGLNGQYGYIISKSKEDSRGDYSEHGAIFEQNYFGFRFSYSSSSEYMEDRARRYFEDSFYKENQTEWDQMIGLIISSPVPEATIMGDPAISSTDRLSEKNTPGVSWKDPSKDGSMDLEKQRGPNSVAPYSQGTKIKR